MFLQILTLVRSALKLCKSSNSVQPKKPLSRSAQLRLLAIIPVLCAAIALLLSVLCVYAGHKPGMMEDYAAFTLNTSRIGENMMQDLDNKLRAIQLKRSILFDPLNTTFSTTPTTTTTAPSATITMVPRGIVSDLSSVESEAGSAVHSAGSAVHSKATSIESQVATAATSAVGTVETTVINAVNKAYAGLISDLHLQDFYRIHISAGCTGTYVFHNGTNVTVGDSGLPTLKGKDSVSKHVDGCSPHSAIDPMSLIRIIYWIGIVFVAAAFHTGIAGLVLLPSRGRLITRINIGITLVAFMFIGLASSVTHGLALGATKLVNFIGNDIGVAGYFGGKFMKLTWATTILLLINMACWIILYFLCRKELGNDATIRSGFGLHSFREKERSRPDRTSRVAMLPISRPMPVRDRDGVPMI